MSRSKLTTSTQDQSWPVIVWTWVRFEQSAMRVLYVDSVDPTISYPAIDATTVRDFIVLCDHTLRSLRSSLGVSGSPRVSRCLNDMITFVINSMDLADQLLGVVRVRQERRSRDIEINSSLLCDAIRFIVPSYEANVQKARQDVSRSEQHWLRDRENFRKQGLKLYLKRQSVSSELIHKKVIQALPTDQELSIMSSPPRL